MKENLRIIFKHVPIVIRKFGLAQHLTKLFIVSDDNQLEVALLASRLNDPRS